MFTDTHLDFSLIKNSIVRVTDLFSLKIISAAIMIFLNWIFGKNLEILSIVYLMILIDTITGVWCAVKDKDVASRGFYRVVIKCFMYFIMIVVSRLVDKTTPLIYASVIMDSFLVLTEAISILENISRLGFPVPTTLIRILKKHYKK